MSAANESSERIPTGAPVIIHRSETARDGQRFGTILTDNAQFGRGSYGVRLADGSGRIVEVASALVEAEVSQ